MKLFPYKNEWTNTYRELTYLDFARRANKRARAYSSLTPGERIFANEMLQFVRDGLATVSIDKRAGMMRKMMEAVEAL